MQFALLIYEEQDEVESRNDPHKAPEYWAAYQKYSESLTAAGVLRGGNALKGTELATTVRLSGSDTAVVDGPFADTKERLGGLFVVEADSLDDALEWARKSPSVTRGCGSVEVRPILEMNAG